MSEAATPEVSLGLRALLLIRLDGREGEYVSVDTLAQVHRLTPDQVRAGLIALHVDGYVRCRIGTDGLIDGACSAVRS